LAAWLCWANQSVDWVALQARPLLRLGALAGVLGVSALVYFSMLRVAGLKWRAFVRF
jgi:putative peptidoglycan lipid II flippase